MDIRLRLFENRGGVFSQVQVQILVMLQPGYLTSKGEVREILN